MKPKIYLLSFVGIVNLLLFFVAFGNEGQCSFISNMTNKTKTYSWIHYDTSNSGLASNFCRTLTFDQEGNPYTAGDNGISVLKGNSWVSYSSRSSLISDIAIDKSGKIWVATDSGLATFDGNEWAVFNPENSPLPIYYTSAVAVDSNNTVWVGCGNATEGGLMRFKNNVWTLYTTDNSILPCRIITKIKIDRNNTVFVGTGQFQGFGGLVKIENGNWTKYDRFNSIMPYNSVDEIAFDLTGAIWSGSRARFYSPSHPDSTAGALLKMKNDIWEFKDPSVTRVASRRLTALAADSTGNIWIATSIDIKYDYALAVYDGQYWYALSLVNGPLPRMFIPDIEVDRNGNVWLATEDGLYMLKESNSAIKNFKNSAQKNESFNLDRLIFDLKGRRLGMAGTLEKNKFLSKGIYVSKPKINGQCSKETTK